MPSNWKSDAPRCEARAFKDCAHLVGTRAQAFLTPTPDVCTVRFFSCVRMYVCTGACLVVVYRMKARKAEGARALAMVRRQVLERKRSWRGQKKGVPLQQYSREAADTAMSRRQSLDAESTIDAVVSPVKAFSRGTKEPVADGRDGDDLCPSANVLLRAVEGVLSAKYPAVTEAAPGEEDGGGEEDRSRYIEALDRLQEARDLLRTALNSATEQDGVGRGKSVAEGESPALVTGRGDAIGRRGKSVASKNASKWEFHCSSRGCTRVVDETGDDVTASGEEQPEIDEDVERFAEELRGACNGGGGSCGDR